MTPFTGPPGSTGRPTLVLSEVQTRPHEYETERHETNYGQVGRHCLTSTLVLAAPLVIVFQCHDIAHLFQFFRALLETRSHDVARREHSDDLLVALDE